MNMFVEEGSGRRAGDLERVTSEDVLAVENLEKLARDMVTNIGYSDETNAGNETFLSDVFCDDVTPSVTLATEIVASEVNKKRACEIFSEILQRENNATRETNPSAAPTNNEDAVAAEHRMDVSNASPKPRKIVPRGKHLPISWRVESRRDERHREKCSSSRSSSSSSSCSTCSSTSFESSENSGDEAPVSTQPSKKSGIDTSSKSRVDESAAIRSVDEVGRLSGEDGKLRRDVDSLRRVTCTPAAKKIYYEDAHFLCPARSRDAPATLQNIASERGDRRSTASSQTSSTTIYKPLRDNRTKKELVPKDDYERHRNGANLKSSSESKRYGISGKRCNSPPSRKAEARKKNGGRVSASSRSTGNVENGREDTSRRLDVEKLDSKERNSIASKRSSSESDNRRNLASGKRTTQQSENVEKNRRKVPRVAETRDGEASTRVQESKRAAIRREPTRRKEEENRTTSATLKSEESASQRLEKTATLECVTKNAKEREHRKNENASNLRRRRLSTTSSESSSGTRSGNVANRVATSPITRDDAFRKGYIRFVRNVEEPRKRIADSGRRPVSPSKRIVFDVVQHSSKRRRVEAEPCVEERVKSKCRVSSPATAFPERRSSPQNLTRDNPRSSQKPSSHRDEKIESSEPNSILTTNAKAGRRDLNSSRNHREERHASTSADDLRNPSYAALQPVAKRLATNCDTKCRKRIDDDERRRIAKNPSQLCKRSSRTIVKRIFFHRRAISKPKSSETKPSFEKSPPARKKIGKKASSDENHDIRETASVNEPSDGYDSDMSPQNVEGCGGPLLYKSTGDESETRNRREKRIVCQDSVAQFPLDLRLRNTASTTTRASPHFADWAKTTDVRDESIELDERNCATRNDATKRTKGNSETPPRSPRYVDEDFATSSPKNATTTGTSTRIESLKERRMYAKAIPRQMYEREVNRNEKKRCTTADASTSSCSENDMPSDSSRVSAADTWRPMKEGPSTKNNIDLDIQLPAGVNADFARLIITRLTTSLSKRDYVMDMLASALFLNSNLRWQDFTKVKMLSFLERAAEIMNVEAPSSVRAVRANRLYAYITQREIPATTQKAFFLKKSGRPKKNN